MADVTVTVHQEVAGTKSIDQVAGGSQITTGQTFAISCGGNEENLVLILEDSGGSATPFVFDAGDYPPAMLQGKGSLTITLAANDLRALALEKGRHMQNDGTITGSCTGGTTKLYAMRMPIGSGG